MLPRLPPLTRREPRDTLFFSPLAWLKLQWFCHAGDTEIGGFGISAEHNPLFIDDFVTVRQRVSLANVHFDDVAVADLFDELVDRGFKPERFARIWLHTHPGTSPQPSSTDETTFARSFGGCDWAVMFIVGRTGQTYARLSFSTGPGGEILLPTTVHWADWPRTVNEGGRLEIQIESWHKEYAANIHPLRLELPTAKRLPDESQVTELDWWKSEPWSEAIDGIVYEPMYQGDVHELLK